MRVIAYLKNSKAVVCLIVVLLLVQAFCDMSLPRYTADIVDVGIQQSGVEHASTDEMRQGTFDTLCMLVSDDDEATLRSCYDAQGDRYVMNAEGVRQRDGLDAIVSEPLVIVAYAAQMPSADIDMTLSAYRAGQVSKSRIAEMLEPAYRQLEALGSSIVSQQAIEAAKAEYTALGTDMSAMQLDYLISVGLQMMGIVVLGVVVAIAVGYLASRTGAKIGRTLRQKLFSKVVGFSDAEIQSFSAASLITRGTNDIQQIQMVTIMLLRMILYAPILAVAGIIMVVQTNVYMSWIIVLAVVVILVLVATLMVIAMPKFKKMQVLIDKVNLVSREILTGLSVIRAFNHQDYEEKRFDAASTDLYRTQLFTNRVMTFMMPLMMLVMNGVSVLIVWVGGSYIDAGTIQTGDMIAFITYSMVIIMSFLMLSMVSIMLPRADVAAGRINEVLGTESSIVDPSQPQDDLLDEAHGVTIEFDDVSFTYAGSDEPVLAHVSFVAEEGKTTAFIGSTGSGKSTVLKLIERFHDVTEGSVRVNGIDIRNLSQRSLRAALGYVPQKAFLFDGTIRSNVAYGDVRISDASIEEALQIAQASDFVQAADGGLEHSISQGGTNVSGGQRQRLAIARALATQAKAYLFDDSFSALDYATDAALRQALHTRLSGKTVLIVAQRISTIMHADSIIVLDEGAVVGCGTHEQLMETCDAYREIALSQLSQRELDGGDAA